MMWQNNFLQNYVIFGRFLETLSVATFEKLRLFILTIFLHFLFAKLKGCCWARDELLAIQYIDLLHANGQKLQLPREFQGKRCCELGISDFARFPGSLIAIIKKTPKGFLWKNMRKGNFYFCLICFPSAVYGLLRRPFASRAQQKSRFLLLSLGNKIQSCLLTRGF